MADLNKQQKIILATGIFPPDIGGPATFVNTLAGELAKAGARVSVLCFGSKNEIDKSREFELTKISRRHGSILRYFLYWLNLRRLAKRADIIYAFDVTSVGLPAALVKLFSRKIKLFVRVGGDFQWEQAVQRDLCHCSLEQFYREGRKFSALNFLTKFVLRLAAGVVFNSCLIRDVYVRFLGLRQSKTVIIKNILEINSDKEVLIEKTKIDKVMLYAGRMVKFKNLNQLIRAAASLSSQGEGIKLEMYGAGPDFEDLKKFGEKIFEKNKFTINDSLEHGELLKKMATIDLVVVPSLTEVNSNLVSEARVLGVPVVLTKHSEQYYVGNKDKGIFYFDPFVEKDLLRALSEVLNFRRQKSLTAPEAWPWELVLSKHEELFSL